MGKKFKSNQLVISNNFDLLRNDVKICEEKFLLLKQIVFFALSLWFSINKDWQLYDLSNRTMIIPYVDD